MAEEKTNFDLDIHIIPTGIYYSHYWKFNRTLIVNFGEPIRIKDFIEKYKQNTGAAIIELRDKIYESILPLIIDFRSRQHYDDFERIRCIYGNHFCSGQNQTVNALNRFRTDQLLARRLDNLEKEKPDETIAVTKKVNSYVAQLHNLKIRNWLLDKNEAAPGKFAVNILVLILGFPVFLYGFIFNAIPFFIIDGLIRKKVKDKTFWSTFFLVAGIILFPLVYLLELLAVVWILPGILLQLAFLISLPFAGKLAFKWYILWRKTMGRFRILKMKWLQHAAYKSLISEKQKIFTKLDELLMS